MFIYFIYFQMSFFNVLCSQNNFVSLLLRRNYYVEMCKWKKIYIKGEKIRRKGKERKGNGL